MARAPMMPVTVRSFRPEDQAACRSLYLDGLLGGKIADNDTGFDIDDIESAYLKTDGNHFWVAAAQDGRIVGMIGVQHHDEGVGEIRRLRVDRAFRRRGIGSALMEAALRFCQERGYLKITLDTYVEREPAIRLFEKFHFHHYRTRTVSGKDLMYFYLDLYQRERPPSDLADPGANAISGA
jgi:ribosomal protein S18 acetylase RimI-like enzyme